MATAERAALISVTVVASPAAGEVQQVDLQLSIGALVRDALLHSGLCPQTAGVALKVGTWGEVLGQRPEGAGVVCQDLVFARRGECHAKLPALSHRVM